MQAGAIDAAFKSFKRLHTADASAASARVIGQLASAALARDPSTATSLQGHLENLPSPPEEDVDLLESAGKHALMLFHEVSSLTINS